MIYKLHKNGSFNIHTIKTDRFKNVRMEIIFRNNIDPDTIARRTCLFEMLLENSLNYPCKRDMLLKQEELYNAVSYAINSKVGNQVVTSICMDFLNPKYTDDDYLKEALEYPFDIIFNPNVTNEEFDEETLKTIKTRMESDIKCINEDPQRLSINKALKAMDKKSISCVDLNGTLEDIAKITTHNLYEEWEYILNHDYIDVFIIGDIDMDKAIDYIHNKACFTTIKNHELILEVPNRATKKVKVISDTSSFSQSQVVFILNTGVLTSDEKKYAANIYNMILGGGSLETKLYRNLRDKNSLCYSVRSIYQKNDNLIIIHTAVDKKNVEKTVKLIKKTIEEMAGGDVIDSEIERATSSIVTAINMSLDQPGRIIDQYLFQYISDLDDIEERLEKYAQATVADVLNVAKKVSINTIYTLESGGKHEKNKN